uniref:KRAB domain-containing protein n=1 Tax=Laticauda laticaudata TaxID=8630 RepID=A0A8C5WVF7_LATLA
MHVYPEINVGINQLKETLKILPGANSLSFDDVAIFFSVEEWDLLDFNQKILYNEVMLENARNVASTEEMLTWLSQRCFFFFLKRPLDFSALLLLLIFYHSYHPSSPTCDYMAITLSLYPYDLY